jgi:Fungal protein kinase
MDVTSGNVTAPASVPLLPSTPAISHFFTDNLTASSTPFAMRIASIRYSDDITEWDVISLDSLMKCELAEAIIEDHHPLPSLVFPDQRLPFKVNQQLLNSLSGIYNGHSWISPPSFTEAAYGEWLNSIGAALETATGHKCSRIWDSSYCNTPLPGTETKRKPDIILLKKGDKPAWPVVCAVGEVTAEAGFPSRIRNTIQQKSFLTFATQPARRFTVSLAFSKDCFQFVTCDRAGVVTSTRVNIDDGALNLLRIVAGLMFGSDELIGYDKSMHRGPDGSIKSITVGKEAEYTVIEPIFSSETVRGRATRCWRVRRDGKQYVLKDSWCHRNRKSEAIILEKLVDMEGVPHLINSDDVMAHGQIDSTAVRRVGLSYKEERVHRRLVVKPVATPLYTFESKKELIQAFVDIVKSKFLSLLITHVTASLSHAISAHKALCEQRHILHRDISLNNLMLYEHSPEDSTRRGLLIDFDYSTEIGGPNGPSDNHRTVCLPSFILIM